MDELLDAARALIVKFKGQSYLFGDGALDRLGRRVANLGRRAVLITGRSAPSQNVTATVRGGLSRAGVEVVSELSGARPNAPREDVERLGRDLAGLDYDVLVVVGGGSGIDAAKAAKVIRSLRGTVDDYFGTGRVSDALARQARQLRPLVAVQMAASSAAHLTKYSNVTDLAAAQKKLIVDEAIVPPLACFQYDVSRSMSPAMTADGAMDGLSHCLEVLYGAAGRPGYGDIERVALTGIRLVVTYAARAVRDPHNAEAREGLGLATDLGGYAIMLGGTNGGHLTSFSLVDILPHGRACALLNPYYTVFFAPAIERPLRAVAAILRQNGLTAAPVQRLHGRELGLVVAEGLFALARQLSFPTALQQVSGFDPAHIERALTAAKDPQLKMKLENMPVPLSADQVDEYMGSVLAAAREGDLSLVRNLA